MFDVKRSWPTRLANNGPIVSGVIAGTIGLLISFGGKGLILGRVLGDPLPLALSVSQITRGLIYFNWRAPLFHTLFAISLGLLAGFVMGGVRPQKLTGPNGRRAGQVAALINVGVVALLQVDALIVGFWYLVAGGISISMTAWVAGKTAERQFRTKGGRQTSIIDD